MENKEYEIKYMQTNELFSKMKSLFKKPILLEEGLNVYLEVVIM